MSEYTCPTCQSGNITNLALVIAKNTRTFGIGTLGFGFRSGAHTAGSLGVSANQLPNSFRPLARRVITSSYWHSHLLGQVLN